MRMRVRLGMIACCAMLAPTAAFAFAPPKAEPTPAATPAPAPTPEAPKPKTQAELEQEAKLKANMKAGTDALLAEFGVKSGSLPGDKPKAKAGPTAPTPPKPPTKPTVTLAPSGG